ncbi:MAG: ATP-dependent helicase [candidate division Zixibacteria bacterium]|nr:ATP-dependent helicase [candidate division Zixibacteria bacterium]
MNGAINAFLDGGYEEVYDFDPLDKEVYTWESGGPMAVALALAAQLRNQAAEEADIAARNLYGSSDRRAVLEPLVRHLFRAYQATLERRCQMDFDRLITGAVALLETVSDLCDRMRQTFRAILVDEYQDTNHAQERLLRALAQEGLTNVTVVGDPRQAIYVWREARVSNIAGFPGTGGPRVETPLSVNFRSVSPILSVANRAIAGYEFDTPPEFDAGLLLQTTRPDPVGHTPRVTLRTFFTREAEAEAVAVCIAQFAAAGRAYRDMAILIRARTYLDLYTDALRRVGIPFDVSAGDAFYTRPEILQAIHLLRVVVDPSDSLALAVTLLGPVVGLSQVELARLTQGDAEYLWECVYDPDPAICGEAVAERLRRFAAFHTHACRERQRRGPASFVGWLLPASGLWAYITTYGPPAARRALHKLLAVSHTYETEHPADPLEDLTGYLRQLVSTEPREKAPELTAEADAVAVMTAHASKGLEFPVVISVDNRQRIAVPQRKMPFHEPGEGLVFPEDDDRHPAVLRRMRQTRNEARCLWYVTLTRAKERMVVTAADADSLQEDGLYDPVRTFFQELWNTEAMQPSVGVERIV